MEETDVQKSTLEKTLADDNSNSIQSNNKKPFIPTHEWQVVEPDQAIPPGLHMRLNLATGINEAKLMDDTDQDSQKKLPALVNTESNKVDDKESASEKRLNRAEVIEALKSFKADMDDVKTETKGDNNFRSYDELKEYFKQMEMTVKTDQEILQSILKEYNDSQTNVDRKRLLLVDLEYYLHQIDNGVYFADSGGFSLLLRDLNNSNCPYKSEILHALGSAVQGNGKAKVEAFKSGALYSLLNLLKQESLDEKVLNRVVYSLSALLRQFPLAQLDFIKLGGFERLKRIISMKNNESDTPFVSSKIRLKIITMISDLLVEKVNENFDSDIDSVGKELKKKQYENVNLEQGLLSENWCSVILEHLSEATQLSNDHDFVEKILHAMDSSLPTCKSAYLSRSSLARDLLELVVESYKDMSSDEYFSSLYSSANKIKAELISQTRVDL